MQNSTEYASKLALTTAVILAAMSGVASQISGLHRTGVNDDDTLAAASTPDDHYTLLSTPSGSSGTAWIPLPGSVPTSHPFPGGWIMSSNASWLAPAANASQDQPPGSYVYRVSFVLADASGNLLDPATASICGSWATDNNGAIFLNGTRVALNTGGFGSLSSFSFASGFQAGTNILDFVVTNDPDANPNPTGILVADLSGTAQPIQQQSGVTVTLVDNSTPGFYNGSIGTILNGTSPAFPVENDPDLNGPCITFTNPPDLTSASAVLGTWLSTPPSLSPQYWTPIAVGIPRQWPVGTESAIVYQLVAPAGGYTNLTMSFGVDNGICVWFDGQYLGGAKCPGPAIPGEHVFQVPSVPAGMHYIQILREDHGTTNDYIVEVTAQASSTPMHTDAHLAVEIAWQSELGSLYQVQKATQLSPAHWANFGQPISGNGGMMSVFDSTKDRQQKFYQVLKVR